MKLESIRKKNTMVIKWHNNCCRMLMRKLIIVSMFLTGIVETAYPWMWGTHEDLARALLENPEINSLFQQTKWDKETVIKYARNADENPLAPGDFPFGEKLTFPGMWGAISDYNRFDAEYLSYARAGIKDFNNPCWTDLQQTRVYPTREDLKDQRWLNSHIKVPSTKYYGDKLFGVLLHQIGDCSMPVGHAPALDVCPRVFLEEAGFEAAARIVPVIGSDSKYVVSPLLSDKDYWNQYCGIFYSHIIEYAKGFCNDKEYYISNPSFIAPKCFAETMKLGNIVILRYLKAVLKKDLPPVVPQLSFNSGTVLNPQIPFGTPNYVIKNNSDYLDTDVKVVAYVRLRDKNNVDHVYYLYNGVLTKMGFKGIIPLNWPLYETMDKDGINKDLIGDFFVYASASGYIPWDKWLSVTFNGGITLAKDNFMQKNGNLSK